MAQRSLASSGANAHPACRMRRISWFNDNDAQYSARRSNSLCLGQQSAFVSIARLQSVERMAGLASDWTLFHSRCFSPPCGDALHHDCADDREQCVVVVVLALVMRVQSGPISRILCAQQKLRVTIIRLGAPLLARSSFLPAGDADHACIANDARPLFGIAPGGGYRANCVTAAFHPCLSRSKYPAIGGLLSVALFRALPRMAVSHHPVLWSPDFPLRPALSNISVDQHAGKQRLSDPLCTTECNWFKKRSHASGIGAVNSSGVPRLGCCKHKRCACKNIRCKRGAASSRASARFSAKSPYLSSPATGAPQCARWTRIWCVRPVFSSASSSA